MKRVAWRNFEKSLVYLPWSWLPESKTIVCSNFHEIYKNLYKTANLKKLSICFLYIFNTQTMPFYNTRDDLSFLCQNSVWEVQSKWNLNCLYFSTTVFRKYTFKHYFRYDAKGWGISSRTPDPKLFSFYVLYKEYIHIWKYVYICLV